MKTHHLVFGFLLLALPFTSELKATTYYVCDCATGADVNCVAGNDVNSGTSSNAPWQSIAKVISVINSLQAGDEIRFAKGAAWTDASFGSIYNFNATAASPIVFDSYDAPWGGTAKPILTEARAATNLFHFADGGNADHDEGYIIRNLDLRGAGTGQWAVFAYNDADYITMDNLDISGFGIGVHSAGANTPNSGADDQNQHMQLLNSSITDCSDQGFLGGGDDLIIEGCHFENNGFSLAIFNHNIYIGGDNGDNIIIRNNELYRSAIVNGNADGVSLVVHGLHDNLLIEGNYIHEDLGMVTGNAWGIAVDPGYGSAEGFVAPVIRGNLLVNMFNIGIGVAACTGAVIENNIIINEAAGDLVGIAAPDRTRDANDMAMTDVTVRNNSLYLRNANASTVAIKVGGEGTGHVVVSNLISMDNGNGFDMDLADGDYDGLDYNMMELLNSASWGAGQTLNTWSASRGFDVNSISGDPLFTAPGSPDYNLLPQGLSPAIDAGHPTMSAFTDYTGAMRTGVADIGAIEGQSILPVALLYFEATLKADKSVRLHWATASESNNSHFLVERSKDGMEWETIARVQGSSISSVFKQYESTDFLPLRGLSYYRLAQVDIDDTATFSVVRVVDIATEGKPLVYPNPATDYINIILPSAGTRVEVSVYNILGNLVLDNNYSDQRSMRINMSSLPAGQYFLMVKVDGHNFHQIIALNK